ncbi:acyl-CoA dehydrogenase family protein [Polaromonas sp. UC242_47]|uniref:acyl-CoA dehydrogenase family protein n=1 Tax=Polaromonas sp. UC242_47 TaxID=3374626 RepID=UPI0037B394B4
MDFALNDEQQMLQESARRFFSERHPLSRARQALPWTDDSQRALWQDMAGMGWLGLLASDDQGGLGLGMGEAYLVAEAAGRQLLNLPLAASTVLLPLLLQESTQQDGQLASWVEEMATGRSAFNVGFGDTGHLDHAQQCSHQLLVHGLDLPEAEVRLALLPVDAIPAPIQVSAFDPTLRDASLSVNSSSLDWQVLEISAQGRAYALAGYRLARAAELLGAAAAALDLSCAYAKQREQFGKAIGSYQAIKHQLANAWMALDNARLAALYAAAALDGRRADWPFACAAAELTAIEGAQQITRNCLQVHGGLGFTWEHDAHLYLKRVHHVSARLGGCEAAYGLIEETVCA